MRPTLTTQQYIEKANNIHNYKYNYSEVLYTDAHTKVTIICPEHGKFLQRPLSHLQNKGCYFCGKENRIKKILTSLDNFILKAKKNQSNSYCYSKVIFNTTKDKIIIICPEHGEFEQRTDNHIQGQGCPKCGLSQRTNLLKSTQEQFIQKARTIHGDKYSYSQVNYINNRTKIKIACPKHGEFEQTPDSHINGKNACPRCNDSKGELELELIFKKYNIEAKSQYRIPEVADILKYDFYLPKYNLLIEFHGIQHYEYIPFIHNNNDDNFLKQKNRDDIVRSNAAQFKYRYLEFNYKQLKYMTPLEFEEMVINKIKKKNIFEGTCG
jgi:hypothetical protein